MHIDADKLVEVPHTEEIFSRNKNMKEIADDTAGLQEIHALIQDLVAEQGEVLDEVKKTVFDARESVGETIVDLHTAYKLKQKNRSYYVYGVGGTLGAGSLGSLGFIAGPVVGAVTTVAGSVIGFMGGTLYYAMQG